MGAQLGGFVRNVFGLENCWTISSATSLGRTSVKCTISNVHQNTNFATSNRAPECGRNKTKREDVWEAKRRQGSHETEKRRMKGTQNRYMKSSEFSTLHQGLRQDLPLEATDVDRNPHRRTEAIKHSPSYPLPCSPPFAPTRNRRNTHFPHVTR